MSEPQPDPTLWPRRMLGVLRIATGSFMLMSGTMKLFGFPPPPLDGVAVPGVPGWELVFGAFLATLGGLAILAGWFTRPVAFVLAAAMAIAYVQVSMAVSIFPTANGGMPAALLCVLFIYFGVAGPGEWSVDERRSRPKRHHHRGLPLIVDAHVTGAS